MYCRNCKTPLTEEENICHSCGVPKGTGYNYCDVCGNKTNPKAEFCSNCGSKLCPAPDNGNAVNIKRKSKLAAGLLAIFLGGFGVHNFYLGFNNKAIAQLILSVAGTVLSLPTCGLSTILCGASYIWGIVEGILIFCGNIKYDSDGVELED